MVLGRLLGTMILAFVGVLWMTPVFASFALIERFGPCCGKRPGWGAQVKGVVFQLIGATVGAIPVFLLWECIPRVHPAFHLLGLPFALIIGDFFLYWEHRFEHRFVWRFHSVHHATRELAGTSNFCHFTHSLFMQIVYGVPVGLLTGDPLAIPGVTAFVLAWSTFIHSPTKLGIGPLNWILQDNRLHRIHHSLDERHHERNFGAIFTFWDFLFGTAYRPGKDEWPDTGITAHGEIQTVRDFLLLPFLRPRRRVPVGHPA